MVKPTRIALGAAILWFLASAISNPGALVLDILQVIADFAGVNIDPLMNLIESINWDPAREAGNELYQLAKDILDILEKHTEAPDSS